MQKSPRPPQPCVRLTALESSTGEIIHATFSRTTSLQSRQNLTQEAKVLNRRLPIEPGTLNSETNPRKLRLWCVFELAAYIKCLAWIRGLNFMLYHGPKPHLVITVPIHNAEPQAPKFHKPKPLQAFGFGPSTQPPGRKLDGPHKPNMTAKFQALNLKPKP